MPILETFISLMVPLSRPCCRFPWGAPGARWRVEPPSRVTFISLLADLSPSTLGEEGKGY